TKILLHIASLAHKKGYTVVNIDAIVAAEEPKIAPIRDAIRKSLATIIGIGADQISIKGKTTEGLGFVGRKEGIEVYAIALLEKTRDKVIKK
ncbi:MAG: ispF, partial [Deltaproteobacteria bacterium]|nr:ispF [Deltaproteobacteria bacterium]